MDNEKLERVLNNHIEFKVRSEKKIITITVKKSELPTNELLSDKLIEKYKNCLLENNGFTVILDLRLLESINFSFVWKKINCYNKILKPIFLKNIKCSCILIKNETIKILVDSISKVYPAVTPFGIFKDYESAMKFVNSVLIKKK